MSGTYTCLVTKKNIHEVWFNNEFIIDYLKMQQTSICSEI